MHQKAICLRYVCTAILHEDTTKLLFLVEATSNGKLPSMIMQWVSANATLTGLLPVGENCRLKRDTARTRGLGVWTRNSVVQWECAHSRGITQWYYAKSCDNRVILHNYCVIPCNYCVIPRNYHVIPRNYRVITHNCHTKSIIQIIVLSQGQSHGWILRKQTQHHANASLLWSVWQ